MNMPALGTTLLKARLSLARFGWGNLGVLLFCAMAAITRWWWVPYLHAQEAAQRLALTRAREALQSMPDNTPVAVHSIDDQRLAQFYDTLGDSGYVEQQIKALFAIATKAGVALNQADYKLIGNPAGRYQMYQIVLPIRGPYRAIREFCEQTLLAIPFASLDQIDFRRDTIYNATPEARLRLTFYLGESHPRTAQAITAISEQQP